jgi:GntR family transcriptional regulator
MRFRIDPASRAPIFQQIVAQVREAVASGALREGDRLPAVRDLAVSLVVNPNTVQKAYMELTAEGVVAARKGLGIFVLPVRARAGAAERAKRLVAAADDYVTEGVLLGCSPQQIRATLDERLVKFGHGGDGDE